MVSNPLIDESNRMTTIGLDNTGFLKFDMDIEMGDENVFNTTGSRLWQRVVLLFDAELKEQYSLMRQDRFTVDNIMKYLYGEQISQIPATYYNKDMQTKYLNFGSSYLYALHGNGEKHIKKWIRERIMYCDTLLGYMVSSSDYITLRSSKLGEVYLDIQTYIPMYVSVKWRDEANNTGLQIKRVGRGETVRFTYNMPTATDQEILVYAGHYLKSLGDVSNLQPTSMLIANADRLTEIECHSPNLINTDLSECKLLQRIDISNSTALGTGIGAQPILNIQNCKYLRYCNCMNTQLTAIYTMQAGGNLEEIYFPESIQVIQVTNQTYLKVLGIPYEINEEGIETAACRNLANVQISNCNNIEYMQYPYIEGEQLNFNSIKYVQELKILNSLKGLNAIRFQGFNKLRSLDVSSMHNISILGFDDMLTTDDVPTLESVKLSDCPLITAISFNVSNNNYKVEFAKNTSIDLGGMQSVTTIESNASIKGLKTIILPTTIKKLDFICEYGDKKTDIRNIWSCNVNHNNDGYIGMDLKDITLDYLDMSGLTGIVNGVNFYLAPTEQHPNMNTLRDGKVLPYFKPEGTLDLSEYTGSMVSMLKGVDLNKLKVIINGRRPQTDLTGLLEGSIISGDTDSIAKVNEILSNYSDSNIWDNLFKDANIGFETTDIEIPSEVTGRVMSLAGMFRNTSVSKDIIIEDNIINVSDMFRNCVNMVEYKENWAKEYQNGIVSDRCYFGTGGELDFVPAEWGGYGFYPNVISEIEVNIPNSGYVLTLVDHANVLSRGIVKWGDKSVTFLGEDDVYSHTYEKSGIYTIKGHFTFGNDIAPTTTARKVITKVSHIATDTTNFNQAFKNCDLLKSFIPDNTLNAESMQEMFSGCSALTNINLSMINGTNCTSMRNTFYGCKSLQSLDLSTIIGTNVKDLYGIFYNCEKLASIDFSNFNTGNVENMYGMFYGCKALASVDLSEFNTGKVQSMAYMFFNCIGLHELDFSSFDTKNVTRMEYMFARCTGITSLDLSSFNTEKVTTMFDMFYNCSALSNLNVSNFNTSKVTDMQSMFNRCPELVELDLSSFKGDLVTTTQYMFSGCTKLNKLLLTNFNTPVNTNMRYMFSGCSSLTELDLSSLITTNVTSFYSTFINCSGLISLNLSNFDTSKAESMQYMFSSCSSLQSVDLSSFNTDKVTTMYNMFINCSSLQRLDLSNFNTEKVNTMYGMFYGCSSLVELNVSSFNTENVTNMYGMFYNCGLVPEIDISNFNTANVNDMQYMFYGCSSVTGLNLSKFNTNKVTTMQSMFYGCNKLSSLDLSSFNTSNLENIEYMFYGCNKLTSLDLSHFITNKVINARSIFGNCSGLKTINLSNWNTNNIIDMQSMFSGCINLSSLLLTGWNTGKVTEMQFMFQNCSSLTELDLSSFNTVNVTNMESMFENCKFNVDFSGKSTSNLKSACRMFRGYKGTNINMQGCSFINSINNNEFITNATNLTDFIAPANINSSITVLANKLSIDSLLSLINGLAEVTTTQTLDIGSTNIGKLTDDQILIATNKNWTVY